MASYAIRDGEGYLNAKDDTENGAPIWRVVDDSESDVFQGKVVFLTKGAAIAVIWNRFLYSKAA